MKKIILIITILIIILIIFWIKDNNIDNFKNIEYINKYTILCHKNDYFAIKEYIDIVFKHSKLILYDDATGVINDDVNYLCIRRLPIFLNNYKSENFVSNSYNNENDNENDNENEIDNDIKILN